MRKIGEKVFSMFLGLLVLAIMLFLAKGASVTTGLFINEKGLAKLVVALARGKKEYDKRQSLKEKEDRREMDRAKKVRI